MASRQAWRERLRAVLLARVREREVEERQVSDTEIDLLPCPGEDQAGHARGVPTRHILVRVPEQASPERVKRRGRGRRRPSKPRAAAPTRTLAASHSDAGRCRAARSAGAATIGCRGFPARSPAWRPDSVSG